MIPQTHLPITRVAKIGKIVSEGQGISSEATKLMTIATEVYIKMLAREAYKWTDFHNRKTILRRDIDKCVQRDWIFTILEDALDDWPEPPSADNNDDIQNMDTEEQLNTHDMLVEPQANDDTFTHVTGEAVSDKEPTVNVDIEDII